LRFAARLHARAAKRISKEKLKANPGRKPKPARVS
jgi:hypothetical protein